MMIAEVKKEVLTCLSDVMQSGKLKPVIDAHNKDYDALQARDAEMEQLIHEFKNTLMIEKIKMDTWENKVK